MNFTGLFTTANDATGGFLGGSTPIIIAIIAYASLSQIGFDKAATSAMFISLIVALPLFALGIVGETVMVLILVAALAATILELKR